MQNNQAIPFNKENFKQIWSKEFALVIIVSIPSALIAQYFNIPLAWFLGPMLITSIVSLIGIKIKMPRLVLSIILIFLGLYIGNYIDKNLFSQIHQWAWTSFIMFLYIVISVVLVSKYLQKFSGYGKKTSLFSAAPGALGPLLILAEDEKSDLSQVATSHLIRLIIIITVFPFFVQSFYGSGAENLQEKIIENQNISDLIILIFLSLILIYLFDKLRLPAALLSGTWSPVVFYKLEFVYKLPPNIIDYCLLILGSSVGCRFANKTFNDIGKMLCTVLLQPFFWFYSVFLLLWLLGFL